MRVGLYNLHWNTFGGGERYAGAIAQVLSSTASVELIGGSGVDVDGLGSHLGLDLSRVSYRQLPASDPETLTKISSEYDLFINSTYASNLKSRARKSLLAVFFPQEIAKPLPAALLDRLPPRATLDPHSRSIRDRLASRAWRRVDRSQDGFLDTYDLIVAISDFTREWINRRWNRPSLILNPPVATSTFACPPDTVKKPIILGVGRFFAGSHNKKHIEMIKVFRRLHDEGRIPRQWELHLVGNVHRNRLEDFEYFADVNRLAKDYPIRILADLSFEDLQREYWQASIFWHATGLSEIDDRQPEKLEHFGITTCEAMSAGCIPIVIAKAGQLEIVQDQETGFLFQNRRALADRTAQVIQNLDSPWVATMRQRATASVQRFSVGAFESHLLEILERQGLLT